MIRRVVLIGLALLTLLAVTPAGAGAYPARVGVSAGEYWLTLSRLKVPAGQVKVEIVNYGEDPHDLKLRRIGGTRTYSIPETVSGGRNVPDVAPAGQAATTSGAPPRITAPRACTRCCASAPAELEPRLLRNRRLRFGREDFALRSRRYAGLLRSAKKK